LKKDENNSKVRYKVWLIVKGFGQKKRVDYEKKKISVVKISSILVMLHITASLDLKIEQLDVKITFLHGDLKDELYMK
jgi:Reverse transcriptase (RNA-dependent DNA polymerase)